MTATPAKFTFNLDMSQRRERTCTLTEAKLNALLEKARQDGYATGHAEGEKSELARTAQAAASAAEKISQQTAQLLAAVDQMRKQTLGQAVDLSGAIAKKLAGELIAREPVAELQALIGECMASLDQAPHLVIRCNEDLAEPLREIAEQRMATSGFSGRLVVMGEPDIPPGDGRIEWVDGGLVRDSAAIADQIDKCIRDYLKAEGVPVTAETEQ